MNRPDPLTYRYPRTLAELDGVDRAGWASAEAAAADDEHIRAQVAERAERDRRDLAAGLVRVALLLAIVALFASALWQGLQ